MPLRGIASALTCFVKAVGIVLGFTVGLTVALLAQLASVTLRLTRSCISALSSARGAGRDARRCSQLSHLTMDSHDHEEELESEGASILSSTHAHDDEPVVTATGWAHAEQIVDPPARIDERDPVPPLPPPPAQDLRRGRWPIQLRRRSGSRSSETAKSPSRSSDVLSEQAPSHTTSATPTSTEVQPPGPQRKLSKRISSILPGPSRPRSSLQQDSTPSPTSEIPSRPVSLIVTKTEQQVTAVQSSSSPSPSEPCKPVRRVKSNPVGRLKERCKQKHRRSTHGTEPIDPSSASTDAASQPRSLPSTSDPAPRSSVDAHAGSRGRPKFQRRSTHAPRQRTDPYAQYNFPTPASAEAADYVHLARMDLRGTRPAESPSGAGGRTTSPLLSSNAGQIPRSPRRANTVMH